MSDGYLLFFEAIFYSLCVAIATFLVYTVLVIILIVFDALNAKVRELRETKKC